MHERRVSSGFRIAHFVKSYSAELEELEMRKVPKKVVCSIWKKPKGSTIEINFDGAFNTNTFTSAVRILTCDREGKVLVSKSLIIGIFHRASLLKP